MRYQPLLFALLLPLPALAMPPEGEITSENGPRLREFLERFPRSDLDQDGVLTLPEMHDYLDEKIKDGADSSDNIRLKLIHRKTPEADLDSNGVLTKEELLAFVKRNSPPGAETGAETAN